MPELPEVETIVRELARRLPGRIVESVAVLHADLIDHESPEAFAAAIVGRTLGPVQRRAKNIVIEFDSERLVVNLGMTGRLLVLDAADARPSHPGVLFSLQDGGTLAYHDVRRFGRLFRCTEAEWAERARSLGFEPLDASFTPAVLHRLTRASRVPIKNWLMDQRRVAGVGNIYASEALFRAAIDPAREARSLSRREAASLHAAIVEVLQEAIEFRGTTLLDYRDAEGNRGEFALRLRVYDRAGEPCLRCGGPILRTVQGGRSTFFCAACQH